jgi:response regulator RpfG family c-di-GMP phosphodiesterase
MVNDRPYRKALPLQDALDELQREAGRQFDPRVVAALLAPGSYDLGRMAGALQNSDQLIAQRQS